MKDIEMAYVQKENKLKRSITRREFLASTGALYFSVVTNQIFTGSFLRNKQSSQTPNILIIITDQLAQKGVGAYGNQDVETPNINSLANRGLRFSNTYTACPLCQPSRASFWTGRLPHETGVVSNKANEKIPSNMTTLGEIFLNAGYETIHFGKQHDAGSLRGFTCIEEEEKEVEGSDAWPVTGDTKRDRDTTLKSMEWLSKSHDKPFLAVVDLNNPHNICKWVGFNEGPHEDVPISIPLPPLPDNFEIVDLPQRPLPIQYLCCTHRRLRQACEWSESNYRHYLAAYYHYTNRVDTEIGLILDALYSTPAGEKTLIICMADHGDGIAAHRMTTKHISFYEETTRVPLIFTGPGIKGSDKLIAEPLVSLIDILPTLCNYANLTVPSGLQGKSLLPWLTDQVTEKEHEYVVSQWSNEYDEAITPGRMLRTERFKYIKYLEENGEEFYDLTSDPGEKMTLINNPNYNEALEKHRQLFKKYLEETNDPFLNLSVYVYPKLRKAHPLGYMHHNQPLTVKFGQINSTEIHNFFCQVNPNPFNASINIQYSLPDSGKITVKIYNQLGEELITLADTVKSAGLHSVNWNGHDIHGRFVATGNYFCRIKFNGHILTETITLVR